MSELVTGEAVALELRPAKLPSRALAVLIDMVVAWSAYLAVTLGLLAAAGSLDDAAVAAIAVATFVLVLVGVPIAVETLSHGRSLGKLACGLRVVRDDGGPIRFRHALVRGAIGVVEILMTFGVVACIASLVSERGRRLGDVFAGTLVVRERVPTGRTEYVPAPPPWLVGRFAELDLSAVPDGLWLAIRQYLTRMGQLDPQVGWAMAERLANDVVARTGAPAPEGVPPAAFLAAVVHERQAREARRAFGEQGAGVAPVPGGPSGPGAPAAWSGSGQQPGPFAAPGYADQLAPPPPSPTGPAQPPQPAAMPPTPTPPAPEEPARPSTGFVPPA
ncbi:RDD family protein [Streptomyces flavofungini]|uniref:RDD family protein n=1 Tax=Streptomyces flavofungini TaxID=68200 RepID=A0ABS0XCF8_9ACTN|nr:RDD family protein [Streptomyces flavofungini]MBJ3810903.1 RDD family protein [Streptomyces flavofungini]GHC62925.1 membrane protein [Streptomyces flavofungini]